MMRPILFNAYEALKDFAEEPPLELTLVDQAAIQMIMEILSLPSVII